MSQKTSHHGSIANMAAIQTAIANHEEDRLRTLLKEQKLDSLQKDYLLELAQLSDNSRIHTIIQHAPEND